MYKIKSSQLKRLEQEYNKIDEKAKPLPFKEWVLLESKKDLFFAWLFADESLEEIYSAEEQKNAFNELIKEL